MSRKFNKTTLWHKLEKQNKEKSEKKESERREKRREAPYCFKLVNRGDR